MTPSQRSVRRALTSLLLCLGSYWTGSSQAFLASPSGTQAQTLEIAPPPTDLPQATRNVKLSRDKASQDMQRQTSGFNTSAEAQPTVLPIAEVLSVSAIAQARPAGRAAYRLNSNPRVLVLDMPNLHDQALIFKRLVLFIERIEAPRDRILGMSEVLSWQQQHQHEWPALTLGNNFRGEDLALFFNTALLQGELLTEEEQWLLQGLLTWEVLTQDKKGYTSVQPEAAVLSVPQPSTVANCSTCIITDQRRALILDHELAHARFITDQTYRHHVRWFWYQHVKPAERKSIVRYLQRLGYDVTVPELLINEAQAFLLHTPESEYFSAAAAGVSHERLMQLQEIFSDLLLRQITEKLLPDRSQAK